MVSSVLFILLDLRFLGSSINNSCKKSGENMLRVTLTSIVRASLVYNEMCPPHREKTQRCYSDIDVCLPSMFFESFRPQFAISRPGHSFRYNYNRRFPWRGLVFLCRRSRFHRKCFLQRETRLELIGWASVFDFGSTSCSSSVSPRDTICCYEVEPERVQLVGK